MGRIKRVGAPAFVGFHHLSRSLGEYQERRGTHLSASRVVRSRTSGYAPENAFRAETELTYVWPVKHTSSWGCDSCRQQVYLKVDEFFRQRSLELTPLRL